MTFNFKLSRLFSKIETRKAAFYFFFATKVSIAYENIRFSSLFAAEGREERRETDVFAGYG